MNETAIALARSYTYNLLGQLLLQGVTADLLPTITAIPDLADHLPHPFDPDAAAAAHHDLFAFNIFPYENFFRAADGLLGGPWTTAVQQLYAQTGYHHTTSADADHLGHELHFLGFLCAGEAQSPTHPLRQRPLLRQQQHAFLHTHLLPWLLPLVQAVRQHQHPLYTAVADLTLALCADHAHHLADLPTPPTPTPPDPPPLLENKQTSLKDIAIYLLRPASSGLYLSRADIGHLGRPFRLPHGFGSRDQMLTNLLRSASQYDQTAALFTQLEHLATQWVAAYAQISADFPLLTPHASPWQTRTQHTAHLLHHIQQQLEMIT